MPRASILSLVLLTIFVVACAISPIGSDNERTDSPDVPGCPSGLIVGSPTTTSLTIAWNSVNNADGYRLYRSTSPEGVYSQIVQTDSSHTQHNDSALSPGSPYYYKIEAYNSFGSSGLSLFASGTTLSVTGSPPETPTGLRVLDSTSSSLTISWNASQDSIGYVLYNSLFSSGPYYVLYDGSLTSVINYNLPSNTTVYYKVAAYNAHGTSPLSNWVSGTTLVQAYPYFGGLVYGDDGQFLGVINDNQFDANSLANSFGTYGSKFSTYSIWNEFGTYGSAFSSLSAYNSFTSTPPKIYVNGVFYAYLTKNTIKIPRLDPNTAALAIGRSDVIR